MGEGSSDVLVNKLNNPLNEIQESTGSTGSRAYRGFSKAPEKECAQENRPKHGVHMDRPKTHCLCFSSAVSKPPCPIWKLTEGQVLEMVLDVSRRCKRFA